MGTHYKGTKKEVTALDTFIKLVRASDSISARLNYNLQKNKLTESQFGILEALHHLGPLCQKDLGNKILKSGGNITMVVDNLEKRGLVKRKRGESDRRFFTVILTKQGNSLIERILPGQVSMIVDVFGQLSEADQIELQRLCKTIGHKNRS
jgi:MarR family transcriptional regulator, 2-MHQ and catechol-resistance regulon repressor